MIPLTLPNLSGNEWKYVKKCLDTGWISSVGSFVTQFENKVADFVGSDFGIAAMNGTSAIHLSLELIGVKTNDLVIVPNITFIASCNAISYSGSKPLLVDVDPYTWQMDLNLLESWLEQETEIVEIEIEKKIICRSFIKESGKRIGAMLPVHVLGNMCNMDKLMRIAKKYHIPVENGFRLRHRYNH